MFLHRTFHSPASNIYWSTKWCHWPSHRSGNLTPFLPPNDKRLSDNERKKIHWDNNHGYKRLNLNFSSTQGDNEFHPETIIWWEMSEMLSSAYTHKDDACWYPEIDAKQKASSLSAWYNLLRDGLCLETAGRDTRCPGPGFKEAMKQSILEQSREITQRYQLVAITFKVSLSLKWSLRNIKHKVVFDQDGICVNSKSTQQEWLEHIHA